ncbi:MAG TPA: hypothetical protein VES59_04710 [Bacteroidota bacterium]|nr:hypothetical protein [Bacteroidota bacterium]
MIQPEYNPNPQPVPPTPREVRDHENAEAFVIGLNASSAVVNTVFMTQSKRNYVSSAVGIVWGLTGIGLGLADNAGFSAADMILGSASIALGVWNLTVKEYPSAGSAERGGPNYRALNVSIIPGLQNRRGVALAVRWEL